MSSKRAIRRKHCGTKRRYPDHAAANSAKIRMYRLYGERLDAYRCSNCHSWHIGHAPMAIQIMLGRVA